jgi:hypothetical protein
MSRATDGVAAEGEQVVAGKLLRSAALTGAAAAAPILAQVPVTAVRRFIPQAGHAWMCRNDAGVADLPQAAEPAEGMKQVLSRLRWSAP